jgi:hypothetical protein
MKYTSLFLILAAVATNLAVVTVIEPRRFPSAEELASHDIVLVQPSTREFHNGSCHLLSRSEAESALRMSRKEAEEAGYHPCSECSQK